jgi:ATP-dependent 26S proteasome regulatory subunit
MTLAEFGMNVVENLVAAIPQLAVVGSTVVYSLKKVRAKTQEFPTILKETKDKMDSSFDNSRKQIAKSLEETSEKISEKVNGSLSSMQQELNHYKAQLKQTTEQQNMLVKENKLFMDVILEFVAKNPEMVKNGISRVVSLKTQLTKKQLEEFPNILVNDSNKLVQALKEAKSVMGEEAYNKLLEGVGNEREEKEL